MATYQRLAGDTNTFAFKVEFDRDPDAGLGATPEESLSWGQFEIWANGRNLCAHLEEGVQVKGVCWYLLPLLEWLAENWDSLLHEERLPTAPRGDDARQALEASYSPFQTDEELEERIYEWAQRHHMQACAEGGLFPDVVLRRRGAGIEVSWGESRLAGQPGHYQFLHGQGRSLTDPATVARALHDVASDAVAFLRSSLPDSERLRTLHDCLIDLRSPHRQPVRTAMLAGLGWAKDQVQARWERVSNAIRDQLHKAAGTLIHPPQTDLVVTGTCQAALMFGSVSPTLQDDELLGLARLLASQYDPHGEPVEIARLANESPLTAIDHPWQSGYALAEELRDQWATIQGEGFVDVEPAVRDLGVEIRQTRLCDRALRAIAIAGPDYRPIIVLNENHLFNTYPTGRRFSIAHELCHILYDREYARTVSIASGPWAPPPVEKRANAFAAMLLMPVSLVDEHIRRLTCPLESPEGVAQLAKAMHVSYTSLVRHLANLGRISPDTDEALLESDPRQD